MKEKTFLLLRAQSGGHRLHFITRRGRIGSMRHWPDPVVTDPNRTTWYQKMGRD